MKFIKLTTQNDKIIFINMELATDVFVTKGSKTLISFGEHYSITVKELPNEIFHLAQHEIIEP